MARIVRALGNLPNAIAASGLFDLACKNGAPVSLKEIGMKQSELDRAADIAVSNPYWNPRPVAQADRADIRELLQHAFEGIRPE